MSAGERRRTSRMTFSIPEQVKRRAQAREDVNCSAVVSQTIEERLGALELMDKMLVCSRLTAKDVDEFANEMDRAMAKRLGIARRIMPHRSTLKRP